MSAKYLTLAEAAAIARTKPESVRYWVWLRKLRGFKPGRALLVREDDLHALIESNQVGVSRRLRRVS